MWAIKLRKDGGGWVWVDGFNPLSRYPNVTHRKSDRDTYESTNLGDIDFTGYNCIKFIRVKE